MSGLGVFLEREGIFVSGEWPGRGASAPCEFSPESFRTDKTAQPAVFPFTERLLLEGADRPLSVAASRPVRRMVVQSNP
jgi:hypothetical protein